MDYHRLMKPAGLGCAIAALIVLASLRVNALAADKPQVKAAASRPALSGGRSVKPAAPLVPRSTTRPADLPKLTVATVRGQAVFSGFTGTAALQEQFSQLQREAFAAKQSGDQAKMKEFEQKFADLRQGTTKRFMAAIELVAKRDHCDVVFGDVVYKADGVQVVDLTGDVIEELNSTATTAPASADPLGARAPGLTSRPAK